ncbi:MAG TPA: deoxyguanosinetriphosphate triphosphohydrolase, partial [Gammaproteobacteria bacterium]|nr:deoxyguanosinetriphosphate triphosphohydrolase [Gammaproteobacteria bacterium]
MPELARYAAREDTSRGRRYRESGPMHRNNYQRDRDRIVHSSAFRRLEYKTQVFVNHEGDMFRTRLTHSIEVSQIGRTIARALCLNEDLTEAVCLAHDLGHTPFGHAGQDILNTCMQDYGGFEHNLQSLRVVDVLEQRYAEFPGLNLMFDTREGIIKHCSRTHAKQLAELGQRFLDGTQPGLEAQVANIADEIAYNNHDVDDGLRSGLITIGQLEECELFARQKQIVSKLWPELDNRRTVHEIIRRMISSLVCDLVDQSQAKLDELQP